MTKEGSLYIKREAANESKSLPNIKTDNLERATGGILSHLKC